MDFSAFHALSLPVKALFYTLFCPEVVGSESGDFFPIGELKGIGHFTEGGEGDFISNLPFFSGREGALLRDEVSLSVKSGREEEKLRNMSEGEAIFPLVNPPFSKNQRLLSGLEGFTDDLPFFKAVHEEFLELVVVKDY